jgi:hypothetical protein
MMRTVALGRMWLAHAPARTKPVVTAETKDERAH